MVPENELTNSVMTFVKHLPTDEKEYLMKEVKGMHALNTRNMAAFLWARDTSPVESLQAELEEQQSHCLDTLQEWLMRKYKWDNIYVGNAVDYNKMIGQVILFAHLHDVPLHNTIHTLHPVPGESNVVKLQSARVTPNDPIVVCNTAVHPSDFRSLFENMKVHDEVSSIFE